MKDQTKEKHFHRRDAVNHPTDWTCNYCDKTLKCLIAPGRARDHLSGGSRNVTACKSVPDAVFNEMVLQRKEKDDQQKALDKTKAAKAELKKRVLEGAEQSGGSKKQTSIAAMETKMRSDLDQQWSRFVFHAGVPFHLTEDPELDEFFIMYERFIVAGLRNWGTPDRKKIGKALDTEYETVKTQVFKEYFANDDYTTMASDGWSNVRSQPVLNYTITGRKGTVFMHAEYPKLVKKDAEYVAQKLVEAKQIYESLNVGSQLTTIVQDNASVMSAANVVLDDKHKEEMGPPCTCPEGVASLSGAGVMATCCSLPVTPIALSKTQCQTICYSQTINFCQAIFQDSGARRIAGPLILSLMSLRNEII